MDVRQRGAPLVIELGSNNNMMTNKQSPARKSTTGRTSKAQGMTFVQSIVLLTVIISMVLGGSAYIFYVAFHGSIHAAGLSITVDNNTNGNEVRITKENENNINCESTIQELKINNDELKRQVDSLQELKTNNGELKGQIDSLAKDLHKLEESRRKVIDYKTKMHETIQDISKRHLIQKYGTGPHQVSIQVSFDPQSNIYNADEEKTGGTVLIELAPIDEMPATVYLFLEQVTSGLMDGCSFHRNAHHVVQGGPAGNFIHTKGKYKDFKVAQLESVPFQEYSANFPHVKYTLGYAGRPGGPDFYISTMDNTRNHGPGGQGSYDDPTEADPCFANVIQGFDIVDQMHQSKVKPGGYNAMEYNIAIVQMKLVTSQSQSS